MKALWLLAGGIVGTANTLTRWWTVSRLRSGMRVNPLSLAWGGFILRLALVTGLLSLGLSRGALPGLLAFAGLWLARWTTTIWLSTPRGKMGTRLVAPSTE
ncbi:MAG: hypothetical protein PVH41_04720 [Anaerolineae bacterium]